MKAPQSFAVANWAWRGVFSMMLRPIIWVPFLVVLVVQFAVLGVMVGFYQPLVLPLGLPLVRLLGGEAATHYPTFYYALPTMFSRASLVVAAIVASIAGGAATLLFAHFWGLGEAKGAWRRSLRAAPVLIPLTLLTVAILYGLGELARLVPRDLMLTNAAVRWGARGGTLVLFVLVQSLLGYTTAWVVLMGNGFFTSLRDSIKVARITFVPTLIVVALPTVLLFPFSYASSRIDLIAQKLRPETTLALISAQILVEMDLHVHSRRRSYPFVRLENRGQPMRRASLLVVLGLGLFLTSCGRDQDAGLRYRAEREFWRADFDYRELMVRPREVKKEQQLALAGRYQEIANRYGRSPGSAGVKSPSREGVQLVAARALFTAAELYRAAGDSTRVDQIYARMVTDFANLPGVAAEVALAQGRIAATRGQFSQAADLYQAVVDRVAPEPGGSAVERSVVDLPLLIARLRTRAVQSTPAIGGRSYYDAAQAWYERVARENPGKVLGLAAQDHLAGVAADQGEWAQAMAALRTLEDQLRVLSTPPRDPAEIRMAIAGIQARATASPEQARTTLLSILQDYPKSPVVPQVLHGLALNADERGQVEESLVYLDSLAVRFKENTDLAAQGLLTRARILEHRDRWGEALDVYRSIPSLYPLAEPALRAPLEIAAHYARVKDEAATAAALEQAARQYRDFVKRYPPGPQTSLAREQLAKTLTLEKKYDEAITELVSLGIDLAPASASVNLLTAAAQMAYHQLSDSLKAADILERMGKAYVGSEIGQWASNEAARLRGTKTP